MTVVLILIIAALLFGIGAVIEGIFWMFLITFVLLALGGWLGWRTLRGGAAAR